MFDGRRAFGVKHPRHEHEGSILCRGRLQAQFHEYQRQPLKQEPDLVARRGAAPNAAFGQSQQVNTRMEDLRKGQSSPKKRLKALQNGRFLLQ